MNYFRLPQPLFEPLKESLPVHEVYARLLERMGARPNRFPVVSGMSRIQRSSAVGRLVELPLLAGCASSRSSREAVARGGGVNRLTAEFGARLDRL